MTGECASVLKQRAMTRVRVDNELRIGQMRAEGIRRCFIFPCPSELDICHGSTSRGLAELAFGEIILVQLQRVKKGVSQQ